MQKVTYIPLTVTCPHCGAQCATSANQEQDAFFDDCDACGHIYHVTVIDGVAEVTK